MQYVLQLNFPTSHNVAEYEALVSGMRASVELGVKRLEAFGDSVLVVDQVMNKSNCTNPKMAAYCAEVRRPQEKFDDFQVSHIPRRDNEAANSLAKITSYREKVPTGFFCSDQDKPTVREIGETPSPTSESSCPSLGTNPGSDPGKSNPTTLVLDTFDTGEGSGADPDPQQDWRIPFLNLLLREQVPPDLAEAHRLAR